MSLTWTPGPKTYPGMTVPGFPDLFVLSGPGGPASLVCGDAGRLGFSGLIGHVMTQDAAVVDPTEEST